MSGVVGLILVGARYSEFMDCSNPDTRESADTPYGWAVAIVASLLPIAIAVKLFGKRWHALYGVVIVVAAFSLVVWSWILGTDCGWTASIGTS